MVTQITRLLPKLNDDALLVILTLVQRMTEIHTNCAPTPPDNVAPIPVLPMSEHAH